MPELPEVETIKLGLQKKIVGKTVKDIKVLSTKSFIGDPKKARGKEVLKVWRRAKILGMDLNRDRHASLAMTLLFHLKMTGQLIYENGKRLIGGHPTSDMRDQMPNSHTRVIFTFDDNSKLFFNDQRKFGWVKIVDSGQGTVDSLLKNLGPEPLEKGFSWQILKENLLKHKNMAVKVALMDQKVVSGIGNIYASEACFNARIDPRKKVGELIDQEFKSLHRGVLKALRDGIKHGGSTRAHFVDSEGHKGYFLDYAYVYGLDKHACKICKTEIKKIQLGGRGTYFCERCQK